MLHAWNEGMASLRSVRSEAKYKALSADIAKAPFSDPEPPSGRKPPAIGTSRFANEAETEKEIQENLEKKNLRRPSIASPGVDSGATLSNRLVLYGG